MEKARAQFARAAGGKRGAAKRQMDPRLAAGGDASKRARVAEAPLIPLEVPQKIPAIGKRALLPESEPCLQKGRA